jgi:hypothetical protein
VGPAGAGGSTTGGKSSRAAITLSLAGDGGEIDSELAFLMPCEVMPRRMCVGLIYTTPC